jgi:hypothetical protein
MPEIGAQRIPNYLAAVGMSAVDGIASVPTLPDWRSQMPVREHNAACQSIGGFVHCQSGWFHIVGIGATRHHRWDHWRSNYSPMQWHMPMMAGLPRPFAPF